MDNAQNVPKNLTSDDLVLHLNRAILEHRLVPGTKLSEDEVGNIYGVGRTVVRNALKSLAHQNLVTIERNRGAFVAKPSVAEARDIFEARALLEPRTAHSAARRAKAGDVKRLKKHIEDEHRAILDGELGRAVYLSGLFHNAIAEIADQNTIHDFITSLVARSSLIIALYWKRRDTLCESHAHHALLDAIAGGDGKLAEELMQSHLVDLLSGLDLSDRNNGPQSLRDMLEAS